MRRGAPVLLTLAVFVLGFVAYEMAGMELPGWHTISFYAHAARWLDYTIAGAAILAVVVFEVWWWRHARSNIEK